MAPLPPILPLNFFHSFRNNTKKLWPKVRVFLQKNGAIGRDRTCDLLVTNELLYQLSYNGIETLYIIFPLMYNEVMKSLTSDLIAHRGMHGTYQGAKNFPENSLSAFKRALLASYAIELDVHLTKDLQLAVFHDHDTKRLTGKSFNLEFTELATLQKLKLINSDGVTTTQHIPALSEVLDLIHAKVPLLIELKTTRNSDISLFGKTVLTALEKYLKSYRNPKIYLQSFDPRIVHWIKKHHPKIPVGLLLSDDSDLAKKYDFFVNNPLIWRLTKPDFLSVNESMLFRPAIQKFKTKAPVFCYTIDDEKKLQELKPLATQFIVEKIL